MAKRPAFQFYPGDWLRSTDVRACSVGARGLWIDMICLMHEGTPYGHLKVNSKVISHVQLARMVGATVDEVLMWLDELNETGVLSVTEDGVFFSRRMVKDEILRCARADGGKKGGNPKLTTGYNKPGFLYAMRRDIDGAIKIGISQDPSKRLYKIRAQYKDSIINVIGKRYVDDMGTEEARIHQLFRSKKSGEWFMLDETEVAGLLEVHLKVNSTPASASASASASLNSYTHGAPAGPPVEPCPSGPSEAFKLFKSIYPRWRGEAEAWRAFQAEVWRLYETRGLNDAQAEQVIIEGAKRFRDSPSGQKPDSPHDPDFRLWPANWLKGGHHADSEEELQKPNRKSDHGRNNTRRNTGAKALPTVGNGDSDLDSIIDRVIQSKPAVSPSPAAAGVREDG